MTLLQVRSCIASSTCQSGKRSKRGENVDMRRGRKMSQWGRRGLIGPRKNTHKSTLLQTGAFIFFSWVSLCSMITLRIFYRYSTDFILLNKLNRKQLYWDWPFNKWSITQYFRNIYPLAQTEYFSWYRFSSTNEYWETLRKSLSLVVCLL